MLSITAESLEKQDIHIKKETEFLFDGVTFTKKLVVPKKFKKDALDFIEEYTTDHLKAILVEHKRFFSVWLEDGTISKIANVIKPVSKPEEQLYKVDTSKNAIAVSDTPENVDNNIEKNQKPIDLLDDSKMREERFELEDLLSSQLKEFGI